MILLVCLSSTQPFEEAYVRDREKFKVDIKFYEAQLTPAQLQQQALEKRQKMAKRKAIRKKRVREIEDRRQEMTRVLFGQNL